MSKFILFKSARATRTIVADDLKSAIAQVPEMNNPKFFTHEDGAFQWVNDTPFELLAM